MWPKSDSSLSGKSCEDKGGGWKWGKGGGGGSKNIQSKKGEWGVSHKKLEKQRWDKGNRAKSVRISRWAVSNGRLVEKKK